MPRRLSAAMLGSLVLAVAGCGGDSAEEKATSQVCDARAGIQKSIASLKDLSASTVTADGVRQQLDSIRDDLKTIRNAQGDLNDDRKQDLQEANSEFASTIRGLAQTVLRSTSAEDAKTELQKAADQFESTYKSTLSPIDCS
jgi:hypothetical protein